MMSSQVKTMSMTVRVLCMTALCFLSTACASTHNASLLKSTPLMHTAYKQPAPKLVLSIDSPKMDEDLDHLKITIKGRGTPGQVIRVLIYSDENEEISYNGLVHVEKSGEWTLKTPLIYNSNAFDKEDNMRIFYTIRASSKDALGNVIKTSVGFAFLEEEQGC